MDTDSTSISIYRQRVVRCLLKALRDTLTSSVIIQGFKMAGLYSQFHLDLLLKKLDSLPPEKTYMKPTIDPESFRTQYWLSSPEHLACLADKAQNEVSVAKSEMPKRLASQEELDADIETKMLRIPSESNDSSSEDERD